MSTTDAKTTGKYIIIAAVIGVVGVILGALINNTIINDRLSSTPTPSSTPLSSIDQILTADAIDTQRAVDKAIIIAMATQNAQATSTQQYINFYNTAQSSIKLTQIYQQAEQDLGDALGQTATAQAISANLTAQADIYAQGTSTALAVGTIQERMDNFWAQIPSLQPTFIDSFDNDSSGWYPIQTSSYSVTLKSQLTFSVANAYRKLPFIWTCDKCGPYNNFLMQVDMTTPSGIGNVLSGVLFGSPVSLDQTFQYSYALLLDSSGAIYLQRLSALGAETIQLWDKQTDIISPDGKPRTIQIIGYDNYISVYVNGKNIVSALQLNGTANGYIGFVVSTAGNTNIQYDNLKIVTMP